MSAALTIARKDFTDSLRSRSVWVAVGLMSLLVVTAWWTTAESPVMQGVDRPFLVAITTFDLWLPLFAIVLGYKSVVGERSSGRVRVLLGQPASRRDVVVGKYLGRSVVFSAVLLVVVGVLLALVAAQFGAVAPVALFGGLITVFLYAFAWIGMTVGVSSFFASETRTIGVLVGLYALFAPLWQQLVVPIFSLAFAGQTDVPGVDPFASLTTLESPIWYLYVNRLSPFSAFEGARYYIPDLLEVVFLGGSTNAPHLPNVFGLFVLLAWAIVPLAVGYVRFQRAELN